MQEDKREKIRRLFQWPTQEEMQIAVEAQQLQRDLELLEARERARLTVLDLTARDKRFLRAMKIEC